MPITRYRDSEIVGVSANVERLDIGGDIENCLPFDETTNIFKPWNLVYAEGTPIGNWVWLGKGEQGYLIKTNTGTVRVYPIRGDQTKYIQVSGLADRVVSVNQIDTKNLEIFEDKPNTRWSLFLTPKGFKPQITLKPGYSGAGDGTFQFRFELNGGLTLSGKKIMDGETEVMRMKNPFLIDANGVERAVTEELVAGVATLTANLTGLTYPVVIDPTLTVQPADADTFINKAAATTNYGSNARLGAYGATDVNPAFIERSLLKFDFTALPGAAVITDSTLTLVSFNSFGDSQGFAMDAHRMTRTDWVEDQATWETYKTGSTWTGGACGVCGDYTDTDKASSNVPVGYGTMDWDITAITQTAQRDVGRVLHVLIKQQNETNLGNNQTGFRSTNYGTPADRPKLSITYSIQRHYVEPRVTENHTMNGWHAPLPIPGLNL